MTNLIWDANFKRSYKKRIGGTVHLKKKFWDAIDVFCMNPFDAKLTGKLMDI